MNNINFLQTLVQQGWQCPLCKKIYAPHIPECYSCNNRESTITTSNTKDTEIHTITLSDDVDTEDISIYFTNSDTGKHSKGVK